MDVLTRPHFLLALGLLAPGAAAPAWAQTVTPPPAAEPLIPDWIWMTAIVILVIAAFWYFLRTRRG